MDRSYPAGKSFYPMASLVTQDGVFGGKLYQKLFGSSSILRLLDCTLTKSFNRLLIHDFPFQKPCWVFLSKAYSSICFVNLVLIILLYMNAHSVCFIQLLAANTEKTQKVQRERMLLWECLCLALAFCVTINVLLVRVNEKRKVRHAR